MRTVYKNDFFLNQNNPPFLIQLPLESRHFYIQHPTMNMKGKHPFKICIFASIWMSIIIAASRLKAALS